VAAGTAKPLVSAGLPHLIAVTGGLLHAVLRAALPLSSRTLNFTAGVARRPRKAIGPRWRRLSPGQEALLVLAYLRKGETFDELAAGFGIGRTTAWRYVNEAVELLAARAPKLHILDGTLIPIDRAARDKPFYPGSTRSTG
jgi:Helix-turn-helix of DDE superfamily endonuclease